MSKKVGMTALIIAIVSLCCSLFCMGTILQNKGTAENTETVVETTEAADETKTQYVMYVGTNDKDTYKPEHTEEEAREIVDQTCLKYFEGYTLQEATGAWIDEKSNMTHEYTLVCYFDDPDPETVYKVADELIEVLNQNTILIEKANISMEYYGGSN